MAFFFGLEVLLNRNRVPLVVEAVKLVGITRPLFRRALGMNLNAQQLELFTIRSGDEVIVTANNLYNGKVIG